MTEQRQDSRGRWVSLAALAVFCLGVGWALLWGLSTAQRTPAPEPVEEVGRRGRSRDPFRGRRADEVGSADIKGRVLDGDAEGPGVAATVTLSRVMPSGALEPIRSVESSDRGRFAFRGVVDGTYRVAASSPDRVSLGVGTEVRIGDADVHHVDVIVVGGARQISGVVSDRLGGELDGALVSFYGGAHGGTWAGIGDQVLTTTTDVEGRYTLNVPAVPGRLAASAYGYAEETRAEVELDAEADFALWPAARLDGRVVDADGEPLPGAFVFATDLSAGSTSAEWLGHGDHFALSDRQGRFELEGVRPGTVELHALHDRGVSDRVTVAATAGAEGGGTRLVVHAAATLRGTVVAAGSGRRLPGFEVSCQTERRTVTAPVVTDHEGRFDVMGVEAEGCHLVVSSTDVSFGATEWVDVSSALVEGLWVEIPVGDPVSGRVDPPTFARIELVQTPAELIDAAQAGSAAIIRAISTRADGTFEVAHTPRGRFTIRATAEDGRVGEVELDRAEEDVVVPLEERFSVAGQVRLDGGGEPGRLVVVARGAGPVARAKTEEDGSFVLRGLADGPMTVGVTTPAGDPLRIVAGDGERLTHLEVDATDSPDLEVWVEPQDGTIEGVVSGAGAEAVPYARLSAIPVRIPFAQRMGLEAPREDARCPEHVPPARASGVRSVVAESDGTFVFEGLRRDRAYRVIAHRTDGSGFGCLDQVRPGARVELEVAL